MVAEIVTEQCGSTVWLSIMPENPSYEELIERVAELEKQNQSLQHETMKYRTLFDSLFHGITVAVLPGRALWNDPAYYFHNKQCYWASMYN